MKFTKFLNESAKSEIITLISDLNSEELSEFGDWLLDTFFEDSIELSDDSEKSDEYNSEELTLEEIIEMLDELELEDLEYILYMLDDDSEDRDHYNDDINEIKRFDVSMKRIKKARLQNKAEKRKLKLKNKKLYKRKKNTGAFKRMIKKSKLKAKRHPGQVTHHRGVSKKDGGTY